MIKIRLCETERFTNTKNNKDVSKTKWLHLFVNFVITSILINYKILNI